MQSSYESMFSMIKPLNKQTNDQHKNTLMLNDVNVKNPSISDIVIKFINMYLNFNSFLDSHDDVIKWKFFPRYWSFVKEIHRLL